MCKDVSLWTRGKLSTKNIMLLIRNTTYTGIRKDKKVFLTPFYPLWTGKDKVLLSNKAGFSSGFN